MFRILSKIIRRFIRALTPNTKSSPKDDEKKENGLKRTLDEVKNSNKYVLSNDRDEVYYIRIYSTQELRKKHGYWPEIFSARVLERAFEDANLGYYIEIGKDSTYNAPTQDIYKNNYELVNWWHDETPDGNSSADLLLSNSSGGVTLGNACVAGGSDMKKFVEDPMIGSDNLHGSHTMGHEVGHAIGVGADEGPEEGRQTAGISWVDEDDRWHRKWMMSTDEGGKNVCGDKIAARDGRDVVYHQEYSDCAIEYFDDPLQLEEII